MQITIHGMASGRIYKIEVKSEHYDLSLLEFLRSKGFTIASSCDGAGVCQKCVIQDGILSCGPTVIEFLKTRPDGIVIIDYL
ncbi:MAG: hypothetical protein WDA09_08905 [Bacteriovoracaceae bacterium]